MNKDSLLEYMKTVYQCESDLMCAKEQLENLKKAKRILNNKLSKKITEYENLKNEYIPKPEMPGEYYSIKDSLPFYKKQKMNTIIGLVVATILVTALSVIYLLYFFNSNNLLIPILFICGTIIGLLITIYKIKNDNDDVISYKISQITDYEVQHKLDMQKYNNDLSHLEYIKSEHLPMLGEEKEKISEAVKKTKETINEFEKEGGYIDNINSALQSYYNIGILHKKYQNMHSVSYFYDYLDTGRCDDLKECMNKYDDDMHYDKIYKTIDDARYHIIKELGDRIDLNTLVTQEGFNMLESAISRAAYESAGIQREMQSMIADIGNRNIEYQNKMLELQYENNNTVRNLRDFEYIKAITMNK